MSGTVLGGTVLGGTVLGGAPVSSATAPAKKNKNKKKKDKKKDDTSTDSKPQPKTFVIKSEKNILSDVVNEDEEDEADYRKGGYHPVQIGNLFNLRYEVKSKLGWGHFSTVWLANDIKTGKQVALKIVKSEKHYTEAAQDEIILLKTIAEKDPTNSKCCVQLVDSFEISGPHGKHICMAFENLSCNLLTIIRLYNYKGLPMPLVKIIAKQMLIGLDYLHRDCHIIHTDLKPENILLIKAPQLLVEGVDAMKISQERRSTTDSNANNEDKKKSGDNSIKEVDMREGDREVKRDHLKGSSGKKRRDTSRSYSDESESDSESYSSSESESDQIKVKLPRTKEELLAAFGDDGYKVKIVDFGNACWTHKQFTQDVQTRQYRAPEVILGAGYDESCDMWSVACIIFELLTGDLLFEPKNGRNYSKNDDHLAQIIELLGHYPKSLTSVGKYARDYFTSRGELRNIRSNLKIWPMDRVLHEKYKFAKQDAEEIADFLVPMLAIRRNKRMTAQQALEHFWIKNIDINDFNTCFVQHPRPEGANTNGTTSNNNNDDAAMEISSSEKK